TQDDLKVEELLTKVLPEDLLSYGLIPEFIGRLPVIGSLTPLDEHALVEILTKPKNALVKQYEKLFQMDNVELEFEEEALVEIAKKAIERKQVHVDCAQLLKVLCWMLCLNYLHVKILTNALLQKIL